jgi:deazaflavin-dependent oxidoreductase (nitroreductase family)
MANPAIKDAIGKAGNKIHRSIFTATNGRLLGKMFGMSVVLLETKGRKSGQPRQHMLTTPVRDGENVILIASWGGDDRHPQWYLNLRANPDVRATYDGHKKRAMRARTATPEEKAELWPRVIGQYKGYGGYQTKTERDIPVVILEPA